MESATDGRTSDRMVKAAVEAAHKSMAKAESFMVSVVTVLDKEQRNRVEDTRISGARKKRTGWVDAVTDSRPIRLGVPRDQPLDLS